MVDHQNSSPHHSESDEARFIQALSSLSPKPKARRTDTLYSLVHRCFDDLKSAKKRGYSYEELATLFYTQLGRTITPGTLRKYMNRAAKAPGIELEADPNEAACESTASVIPSSQAPQSMPLPKHLGPKPVPLPRSTLYVRDPRAQASEDEFENL
ncbi:hypothetical protein C7293_04850 [filamentous cyanobacterium CCT1]|nr:hypothetical protein C7293_04850 [filamentous cyanobacterium CCT1]PSN79011.1 hypothetical protein C8B47_13945 [filamentous cyanobacterium CCP4]